MTKVCKHSVSFMITVVQYHGTLPEALASLPQTHVAKCQGQCNAALLLHCSSCRACKEDEGGVP